MIFLSFWLNVSDIAKNSGGRLLHAVIAEDFKDDWEIKNVQFKKKNPGMKKSGKYNFLDKANICKEYVSYSQYSSQGYQSSSLLPYLTDDVELMGNQLRSVNKRDSIFRFRHCTLYTVRVTGHSLDPFFVAFYNESW